MTEPTTERYAVFAEAEGYDKALIELNLTFARLMDDVVVPYQTEEAFFIDGAPLIRKNIRRLKIIRQRDFLTDTISELHWSMRSGNINIQKLYAEQYIVRLEALLREAGEDVTSQVIKAFDRTIRPSLKDYLPKRDELLSAATKAFLESIRMLI